MSTDRQSLEKHMTGKEVLRAIADGADPSEFEWYRASIDGWGQILDHWRLENFIVPQAQFRRKPRTRVVNGFTVPASIQEMPEEGDRCFLASPEYEEWFDSFNWIRGSAFSERVYARGLMFSTKEAAIANAKAMVGVDPEAT